MTTQGRASGDSPEVLAFYLPQFHQVSENDAWHGPGFTEWNVVVRSKPLYPGHRQPDLPGELGFYDLRVPETRYRQAQLARDHGITGFLYYHYWFGGRRMLGRPLDEVRALGHPDFPFALCWANESWFRRWRSSTDEMLLEQAYSEDDDVAHIRWLVECFKDPRYIRIEGRPLLTVYRAHYLPEPTRTVEVWRAECERAGMEPPWLVMFETEEQLSDPELRGFDASAEFVPHRLATLVPSEPIRFGPNGTHSRYEYDLVASAYLDAPSSNWRRYPCVATGWDNTPRRQAGEAMVLGNSTPDAYGRWLAEAASRQMRTAGSTGIVFINAWNEWAEGAHLEPDEHWGRAYLEATRDVLHGVFGSPPPQRERVEIHHPQPTATEDLYHDLYSQFTLLQQSASGYLAYADRRIGEVKRYFEAKLEWANHKGEAIADSNDWLLAQLRSHDERIKELTFTDSTPLTDWLRDPGAVFGLEDEPADEPAQQGQPTGQLATDEQVGSPWGRGAANRQEDDACERSSDERRRDDGYDDLPPATTPVPQWLLERGSSV